ncbi:MAG TPA: nitrilotriacetate monooxygenase, partial [Reyranella sp.]|nr:nitrilotriacetate monooxygenase [Reyranella sp.]
MTSSKKMALGMLVGSAAGGHPAAWLHPKANASGSTDIDYYRSLAQLAERGLFDLFFIADTPAART